MDFGKVRKWWENVWMEAENLFHLPWTSIDIINICYICIQYKSILSLMLLPCNFLMAFHFTIIQFVYVDLIKVDFPLGRFVCIIPIQVSFAFSTFVLILILNDWFCFFISFIFFKCHFDDLILEKKRLCNLNTRKPSM